VKLTRLPPLRAEIKNCGSINSPLIRLHVVVLNYIIKYRDNFTPLLLFPLQVKNKYYNIRNIYYIYLRMNFVSTWDENSIERIEKNRCI
jgi:hypothetical protein